MWDSFCSNVMNDILFIKLKFKNIAIVIQFEMWCDECVHRNGYEKWKYIEELIEKIDFSIKQYLNGLEEE